MNPRRVCIGLAAIAFGIIAAGIIAAGFAAGFVAPGFVAPGTVGVWPFAPGPGTPDAPSSQEALKSPKPASPLPPALARKHTSPPGQSPRSRPGPAGAGQPSAGRFLVASRILSGPFFAESIVLLLDYSAQGALGLVINRPTKTTLSELLPEVARLSQRHDRVHRGGPVDPGVMTFLIRSEQLVPGGLVVAPGVYATPDGTALGSVIRSGTPASHFRAFVGYSGWGPGQLDRELARGDWHVGPARAEAIFDDTPHDLWQRTVVEFEGIQVRQEDETGQPLALRRRLPRDPRPL